jgi:hypothetical protein
MSMKRIWKRNKKATPSNVIFILFRREIPEEARSRGMVMRMLKVIDSAEERRKMPFPKW